MNRIDSRTVVRNTLRYFELKTMVMWTAVVLTSNASSKMLYTEEGMKYDSNTLQYTIDVVWTVV